ncbi:MAG: peptide chain release factor N(5)-glutamine methyltransferase [Rhodospirillales bacterium]|nr:peptide chain release factor N(5)-glutamine methyltransferase [Alphaproteobacteria bacterium]MBL6948814.1 peptide chain release factor N(5)-glutamine methyltransferase [Rhodospirillales bacterium]
MGRVETLGTLLDEAVLRFEAAGIDSARLDARLLAAHAFGWDASRVIAHPDHMLEPGQREAFEALLVRREGRESVAHIVGQCEFWSLDFTVTGDVLAPRPDSETLIEVALKAFDKDAAPSILDFGTGTGCLLLALLSEWPEARGLGVDISEAALAVAKNNARRLGLEDRVRFQMSDWDGTVDGQFDLIISNPPYIADGDFPALAPEVARHEPRLALSGGADGLDCYRALGPAIARRLAPGARAFVEIGFDQGETAAAVLTSAGLEVLAVHRDLAGNARVIEAGASKET